MHCFFEYKNKQLTVLDGQQQWTFSIPENVWDMLCYAMKTVYIDGDLLKKYGIEEKMMTVLTTLGVLIACDRQSLHGVEAWGLYYRTQQPNRIDVDLSDDAISAMYNEAQQVRKQHMYYPLLNNQFVPYTHDHTGDWKQDDGPIRGSTRQTSANKIQTIKPLLGYIQTYLLKKPGVHLPWGSAGGRYSVYGILVTKTDDVYVFHPLQGVLWHGVFPGIAQHGQQILVPHLEYEWDGYQAMLVLACDPSRSFKKYGNRGLRYVMMESGALGCLFRNAYASVGYLEVGGWYEQRFEKLMDQYTLFADTRKQLWTHLLLFA